MRSTQLAPVLLSLTFAACENAPPARSSDAPVDAPASAIANDTAPTAATPSTATATATPSTATATATTATPTVVATSATAAPSVTTSSAPSTTSRQPLVVPPLETRCAKDDDCTIFDTDLSGPTACCGGCTWHAATKSWLTRFQAACTKSPAPMCPPIGCAMPIVEPRCVSGKCVAAGKR